jgi:hypothetical protein
LFQPLWQLTPSKLCLDTLWLMPNQSAAAHHLATPFPGPQPWEAPDPLPVMRRELKLLLIEMNVLRVEVEQLRAMKRVIMQDSMPVTLIQQITSPTIRNFTPHWRNGLVAQHSLPLNDPYCQQHSLALTNPYCRRSRASRCPKN